MSRYTRPSNEPRWQSGPAANDNLPRLLTREQAAAYCGYSRSGFSRLVAIGALPGPITGLSRWDKKAIDARLDKLSGIANDDQQETAYEAWKRMNG